MPKPVALRVLKGNPGKKRIPEVPKPAVISPERPANLSASARKVWDDLEPKLFKLGLLTEVDGYAFAELCELEGLVIDLRRRLVRRPLVRKTRNGYDQTDEILALKTRLQRNRERLWARFGLSPADRTDLEIKAPADASDESDLYSG